MREAQAQVGTNGSAPAVDFWFEFGSQYSYLSVMRAEDLSRRMGVRVHWKPFLLGPIFKSFGWSSSPFVLQKEKGAYTWKDLERQCRKYGLPWKKPSQFPRSAVLPHRVALLGAGEHWIGAFCREIMSRNFVRDTDIDSADVVGEVLEALGLPAGEIIRAAQSDANKARLRSQTEQAMELGIFGAPTFFAGSEMFWGNDRMEDAFACCLEQAPQDPLAGTVVAVSAPVQ